MSILATPQYGQNTDIDTAAELLTADTIKVSFGTQIKALPGNSGVVYVGLSNAVSATTGYALSPGQEMFVSRAEADDAGDIWVIGSEANQGVCWRAV